MTTTPSLVTEPLDEDAIIHAALSILRSRPHRSVFASPEEVTAYLRLQSQGLQHEAFCVLYLDTHHRFLGYERLFRGTLSQTTVHPREVVKQALAANAASVVLHHNHPSGLCSPSSADHALTRTIGSALALVDVQVLDHVVTSDGCAFSMAEAGLM